MMWRDLDAAAWPNNTLLDHALLNAMQDIVEQTPSERDEEIYAQWESGKSLRKSGHFLTAASCAPSP